MLAVRARREGRGKGITDLQVNQSFQRKPMPAIRGEVRKIRRPKAEIRKNSEVPRARSQRWPLGRSAGHWPQPRVPPVAKTCAASRFGFRASDFFRFSDFELRISKDHLTVSSLW